MMEVYSSTFLNKEDKGIPVMLASDQICREFSLDEIKEATRNFDDQLIIGKGGFGLVYLGSINGGAKVAIKRLSSESTQGATEFFREIQTLSKLQHANLVRLQGYCNESPEKILVYEYMPNGTLADHLYKSRGSTTPTGDNQPSRLTWEQRLNICIGAAEGLDFLHRGALPGVIHRDIKATNILLDGNFMAKIADFGLAKLVKTTSDPDITSVSTTIFKGTFGYLDPEYFYTQRLTTKTDVYAFGVVLLVVLSGRPAVDNKVVEDHRSLTEWAKKCIEKNRVDLIIDPYLIGTFSSRSLKQLVKVSQRCLTRKSEQRPTMEEVVSCLQLALYQQITSGTKSRQPNGRSNFTQMFLAKFQKPKNEKQLASLAGCLCSRLSLDEIKTATQNFSNIIGRGTYGKVYLGLINHGADVVAVKSFVPERESYFLRDIEKLGKLQHDNVIHLKGYCYESSEMFLVYEYMSKGSLEDRLVKGEKNQHRLTWEQRLNICLGVARGLDFLHRVTEPGIIHTDVNCSNIMLDDNFVPKIKDFSLGELPNFEYDIFIDRVCGTLGYTAPEYFTERRLSNKIDVYSFGVVLLVVLSGASPMNWVGDEAWRSEKCIQDNRIDKLIDPDLSGQFKSRSLEKFLEVAQNCLHEQPEKRPTMEDVVAGIGIALEKQLDYTSPQWVESDGLPNLLCLLQPRNNIVQDEEYSKDMQEQEQEHRTIAEYSSELYGEFLEEYPDK